MEKIVLFDHIDYDVYCGIWLDADCYLNSLHINGYELKKAIAAAVVRAVATDNVGETIINHKKQKDEKSI